MMAENWVYVLDTHVLIWYFIGSKRLNFKLFDFHRMYQLIREEPEFETISFTPEILEEAIRIKGVQEIHDRIIAATARFYNAGIITKDRVLLSSGEVETI